MGRLTAPLNTVVWTPWLSAKVLLTAAGPLGPTDRTMVVW